jgi:hypothetical protein
LIAVSASLPDTEKQKLRQALTNLPDGVFKELRFFGLRLLDEKLYETVIQLSKSDLCN